MVAIDQLPIGVGPMHDVQRGDRFYRILSLPKSRPLVLCGGSALSPGQITVA
jgi:hypothetical protein